MPCRASAQWCTVIRFTRVSTTCVVHCILNCPDYSTSFLSKSRKTYPPTVIMWTGRKERKREKRGVYGIIYVRFLLGTMPVYGNFMNKSRGNRERDVNLTFPSCFSHILCQAEKLTENMWFLPMDKQELSRYNAHLCNSK